MRIEKWLTITSNGSARITSSKPNLRLDEISIFLEIEVPNELFTKPRLEAKIEIPKEAAAKETINAGVIENVQEAIKSVTGLDFKINVINESEEQHD